MDIKTFLNEFFAFTINEVQNQSNTRKKQRSFNANLKIGKSTIPFQIDSGSSVNIIDETTFQCIKKNNPNIVLRKSRKRLFGFGSQTRLPLVGQFECVLESKKRITSAKIVVVKGTTGCLLSGQTSIDLSFLTVKISNVKPESTFTKLASQKKVLSRLKPMVAKYDKVVHGVRKLTDVQVHLHINKEIKTLVQPTRRIPFTIRKKVESELVRLQKEDIIEPLNLADISAPLRALTHKDAKWSWGPRQKQAFENLKHVLTTETTMAYFNSSKKYRVIR